MKVVQDQGRTVRRAALLATLVSLLLPAAASAADSVHWASESGFVGVGNLDGSGTASTLFGSEGGPCGVAIDSYKEKIYWANFSSGTIRVANLDGSGTASTRDRARRSRSTSCAAAAARRSRRGGGRTRRRDARVGPPATDGRRRMLRSVMQTCSEADLAHLERAVALAAKGIGRVNPNPVVGAVIAAGGSVIGEGWHEELGGCHAEVNAITACAGADLADATLYVTLEPCCHFGRTPPCTDAILAAGIRRVVVGSDDPRPPRANGRGLGHPPRTRASRFVVVDGELGAPRAAAQPGRSASTPAPDVRGCCSSPR